MKITTRIKLFFNKRLRNELSCCGCEMACHGSYKIRKEDVCHIRVWNYEHQKHTPLP